jgi:Leucine Rich repeat
VSLIRSEFPRMAILLIGEVMRPRRAFVRFSIRGLIVLVLLAAIGLGSLARSVRAQRDAVATTTRAGGSVKYDWESVDKPGAIRGNPWAPSWLVDLVGVDYFGHVTFVELTKRSPASDAAITQLGTFSRLTYLDLRGSSLNDDGLANLIGLTELRGLDLSATRVTDAGLVHLERMTNLTSLRLHHTSVTDAGLVHLVGLTNLTSLDLDQTNVTDAGMVHLRALSKLSYLELGATTVSDAGLAQLTPLTNLKHLFIDRPQVTFAGLRELERALPRLWISTSRK